MFENYKDTLFFLILVPIANEIASYHQKNTDLRQSAPLLSRKQEPCHTLQQNYFLAIRAR